jgi:class 3 adenylate cyclase
MSIRAKISMLAAALLLLLATVGGIAIDGLWRIHGELRSLHEQILPLDVMLEDLAQQEIQREAELYAMLRSNAEGAKQDPNALSNMLAEEAKAVDHLVATVLDHHDVPEHPEITAALDPAIQMLADQGKAFAISARGLAAALGSDNEAAAKVAFEAFVVRGQLLRESLGGLTDAMRTAMLDAAGRAEEHEERVQFMVIVAAVIALIIGVIGTVVISGRITKPIRALVAGAKQVEDGDLDTTVAVTGRDEISSLSLTFNEMVAGLKVKEEIKDTFGKYIDPRIVERLIGDGALLDSNKRSMTVTRSQYAGFAKFSEQSGPEQIVERINAYYSAMADEIADGNGVVDKMMGDTVLAFFGPPFTPGGNQAELACLSALRQTKWRPANSPAEHRPLIAIASDASIVGTMGSERTRSFTIMGDNVAVAETIASACRVFDLDILLNGATKADLGDQFITRHVDTVEVTGRSAAIELYELIGTRDEVGRDDLQFVADYEAALKTYKAMDFDRARDMFEACSDARPDDQATQLMLERLDLMEMDPPEDDWSGAWPLARA